MNSKNKIVGLICVAVAVLLGCDKRSKAEPPCEICNYEGARLFDQRLWFDINGAIDILDTDPESESLEEMKKRSEEANRIIAQCNHIAEQLNVYYHEGDSSEGLAHLKIYETYLEVLQYKSDLLSQELRNEDALEKLEKLRIDTVTAVTTSRDVMGATWGEPERRAAVSMMMFVMTLCDDVPKYEYVNRGKCLVELDSKVNGILSEDPDDTPVYRAMELVVYRASFGIRARSHIDGDDIKRRCTALDKNYPIIESNADLERDADYDDIAMWQNLLDRADMAKSICLDALGQVSPQEKSGGDPSKAGTTSGSVQESAGPGSQTSAAGPVQVSPSATAPQPK